MVVVRRNPPQLRASGAEAGEGGTEFGLRLLCGAFRAGFDTPASQLEFGIADADP
jgi:hypothetical protein